MGYREHTTFTVECDICGRPFGGPFGPVKFESQTFAHKCITGCGWTDDTNATKCPEHVGVITRQEPWWHEEEE